jgi:hypothetical protein
MVLAKVATALNPSLSSAHTNFEAIAERIEALVRSGRLDSQGDLKKWRFSEVRRALKQ